MLEILVLIVISVLLVLVWVIDPSRHPIGLASSGCGVFLALGIYRGTRRKRTAESGTSDESRKQIRYGLALLTTVVGPLTAALSAMMFPHLIVPIVVTVMCVVSLLSLFVGERL